MFTHSRFTPICLALGVALSSGSSCVYAQSTNTVTLTDAISRLSAQYKVVILTTIADSDSVKVPPVTASVTIEQALATMLAGTELEVIKDGKGSYVIQTKSLKKTSETSQEALKKASSTEPTMTLGQIEEIVITAQKTSQNLQQVAASISAVNGENLEKMNVNSVFDLSGKLPGLVMTSVQGYRPTVSIRGIGNEIPDNAGTKQAVAFHVDGVFMANDYALLADMSDVSRIEMTRGPDGTLYGNSSTGGAINLVSHKPQHDELFGAMSFAAGAYSQQEARAMVNVPVNNELAFRVSASHRQRDGYTENKAIENYELDDVDNETIKAQISWQPSDDINVLFQHQVFSSDTHGPALKGGFDTISDDPRVVYHDTPEFYRLNTQLSSFHFDWTLPGSALSVILSKQRYHMRRKFDFDRSSLTANDPAPLPLVGELDLLGEAPIPQFVGNLSQLDHSYTAEINLTSAPDADGLKWVVGAFFLDTEIFSNTRNFYDADRDGEPVNETITGPNIFADNADIDFINSDYRNFNSYAIFGQFTYPFSTQLAVTAGLRFTNNEFEDERCSLNCVPTRSPITSTPANETDNVTGKVALEYTWNQDMMSYVSIATGVKPAGSNSSADTRFFPEVFDQEEVIAYEVGNKAELFNKRSRLNIAAFYYDYKDYLFESSGIGRFASGASNLPEAEIYGIEVESDTWVTESLSLTLSLSAMESEIIKGRDAIDRAEAENQSVGLILAGASSEEINAAREATAINLTGNELPKIPDLMANVGLVYYLTDSMGGEWEFSGQYTYRGEFYARAFNSSQRDNVPSYGMTNLNVTYFTPQKSWKIDLNVHNLFDEDAVITRFTDTFGLGFSSDQYLAPRTVTLRAKYFF